MLAFSVRPLALALSVCVVAGSAFAQVSPVGLWRTIDDETKTEKSLVRISESAGVLSGKIEKIEMHRREKRSTDSGHDHFAKRAHE